MKNKKLFFSTIGVVMVITVLTFIISNTTQAYANQVDAPVQQSSTSNTSNNTGIQSSTRKPPVSIAAYSNVVTESADTYDYDNNNSFINNNTNNNNNNIDSREVSTSASISNQTNTTNSTVTQTNAQNNVPKSTGLPSGETEPDIITYPPTIAPEYTD